MKALIAEDDTVSRRMLETFLVKWGFQVVAAREGKEAWKMLQEEDSPKLAILDWMMPGLAGIDICRSVREMQGKAYVYIILLTARGHKEDMVKGLEAGADDYMSKPFDPVELRARLRAGQRIVELHEQLFQAQEALREQASRDPLTGLWNHGAILAILRKEVARAIRTRGPFALAMADVDKFKTINDTYGHLAGDAVLREASQRLRGVMRGYDSLGRYGGDEFLAVIPGCDPSDVARFAESFRARIGCKAVETPEGSIAITLSLGVAAIENLADVKAETLVRVADAALYRAKVAGRNCVALANEQEVQEEIARYVDAPANQTHDAVLTQLPSPYAPI
jgi:two-component system, cell cycle response regulator